MNYIIMKFKQGDNETIYVVHSIYDNEHVSLRLKYFPDIEQDYQTHINEIIHA